VISNTRVDIPIVEIGVGKPLAAARALGVDVIQFGGLAKVICLSAVQLEPGVV